MKKYLWRNLLWCIVILILCSLPGDDLPKLGFQIPHIDKIVHFGLFYVLSILLCAELKFQTKLSFRNIAIVSVIIVGVYGATIELLQHYVFVSRSGDYVDLLFDILGGIVGVVTFRPLKIWKDKLVDKSPFNKYPLLKKIL